MSKTVIKAPRSLNGDGLAFVREYLKQYDLSKLSSIRIKHEPYTQRKFYPSVWGNCKPPNPFGKTHKTRYTYRMEIKLRGEDKDLPYKKGILKRMPRKYGGGPAWPEVLHSMDQMLVWVCGHEMYHFLCWTKQLNNNPDNEIQANYLGNRWLRDFKEWRIKNGRV